MAQYEFGTGELWGVNTGATPNVPTKFGALQSVSLDINFTTKELYSQYQFPVAVARGTAKVTFKAAFAQFYAGILNQLFFNQSSTTGQKPTVISGEAQSVPAVSTYTVTVANATGFQQDLGVRYAATGIYLTPVTTVAAVGQYSVNTATGVYTFFSGDASAAVLIDYTYNPSGTSGYSIPVANQLLGTAPQFQVLFRQSFQGNLLTIKLNACMSNQLSLATKLEDYTIPDFTGQAFADASNNIMTVTTAQ